jgi:ElaB/YqjD/DUF883 family membrane-anchored ribosome-binding protein
MTLFKTIGLMAAAIILVGLAMYAMITARAQPVPKEFSPPDGLQTGGSHQQPASSSAGENKVYKTGKGDTDAVDSGVAKRPNPISSKGKNGKSRTPGNPIKAGGETPELAAGNELTVESESDESGDATEKRRQAELAGLNKRTEQLLNQLGTQAGFSSEEIKSAAELLKERNERMLNLKSAIADPGTLAGEMSRMYDDYRERLKGLIGDEKFGKFDGSFFAARDPAKTLNPSGSTPRQALHPPGRPDRWKKSPAPPTPAPQPDQPPQTPEAPEPPVIQPPELPAPPPEGQE